MLPLSEAQVKSRFQDGLRQMKAGDLFAAQACFDSIAALAKSAPEIPFQLGKIALSLGRPQTAVARFEHARTLAPKEPGIQLELAKAYGQTGQIEAALAIYTALGKADPQNLKFPMDRALLLQQSGDFAAAEKIFRASFPNAKNQPEFYRLWFAGRKIADEKEPALREARRLWDHPRLNVHGRVHLGFALAKAMEDLGRFEAVFPYLDAANAAQQSLAPYNREERAARLSEMRRIATAKPVARRGSSDAAPIFIIGMPRSGTTLVEQILASHGQVVAGGEIAQIRPMAYMTFGKPGSLPPIIDIDPKRLDLFAERYVASAREITGSESMFFCDKSMQTQLVLGLVAAAFPKARFVVVRRDPYDIALSIYKNHFMTGTHAYATSLPDIAHQMRTFDDAIAFWQDYVPLAEISYDALTSDPEAQTRALVDAAGLPWDDRCLDHHKNASTVKTLSISQVRKPIYQSSRGGWRKYEAALAPFKEAWEGSL